MVGTHASDIKACIMLSPQTSKCTNPIYLFSLPEGMAVAAVVDGGLSCAIARRHEQTGP